MSDSFHPSNQRPPKAKRDLAARISKIGTVSRCLEDAISDLIREEDASVDTATAISSVVATASTKTNTNTDEAGSDVINGSSSTAHSIDGDNDDNGDRSKAVPVERTNECQTLPSRSEFKTKLLEKYGEAVAGIDWDDRDVVADPSDTGIHRPTKKRGADTACPPAAILLGTMTYYNRIGGQWRIVVSDGEIRRRVNFDYTRDEKGKKRKNGKSLWDQSDREGDVHDSIKFDSPLLILAYDDI